MLLKEFKYQDKQDLLASAAGSNMTFAIEIEMEFDENEADQTQRRKFLQYSEQVYSSSAGRIKTYQFEKKYDSKICKIQFFRTYCGFNLNVRPEGYIPDYCKAAITQETIRHLAEAIPVYMKSFDRIEWPLFLEDYEDDIEIAISNRKLIDFLSQSIKRLPFLAGSLCPILIDVNNIKYEELFDKLVADGEIVATEMLETGFSFAESTAERYFADIIKNYNLEIVSDGSLSNGIEMKPKTYIKGIINYLQFIEDFYKLFNDPSCPFFFDYSTGLHVNIGYEKGEVIEWNLLKLFLFLGESTNNFYSPGFAYNFNRDRYGGRYAKPWKKKMFERLIRILKNFPDVSGPDNNYYINTVETHFNIEAINSADHYLSLDLQKLTGLNYIEFRYLGDDISKETLIQMSMYYAYLIRLASDLAYKQNEYIIKYAKFAERAKTMGFLV